MAYLLSVTLLGFVKSEDHLGILEARDTVNRLGVHLVSSKTFWTSAKLFLSLSTDHMRRHSRVNMSNSNPYVVVTIADVPFESIGFWDF